MLARIADNLFWIGRYLERAEHTARYAHVHAYAALDAPNYSRAQLNGSILRFTGLYDDYCRNHTSFDDRSIAVYISLEEDNLVSIRKNILFARENTRGARDCVSTEMWEAMNKMYHISNEYSDELIRQNGLWDFTEIILRQCAVVNGYIENSLIHDEAWAFIRLGTHIERAIQLSRAVGAKLEDIKLYDEQEFPTVKNYHGNILLRSMEAFDMCRIYHKSSPNWDKAVDFLLLNSYFPRSIKFCLERIMRFVKLISHDKLEALHSLEYKTGKLLSTFTYVTANEIVPNLETFLEHTQEQLVTLAEMTQEKYLIY